VDLAVQEHFKVTKQIRPFYLVVLILAILLVIPFLRCDLAQEIFRNPNYIYEDGAVLVGGDDRPVEIINNEASINVNYTELKDFISRDQTDKKNYVNSGEIRFICSDFAEMLHNNAEAYGIRAGYAGIDWEEGGLGHAINAFETVDMGLVFVDCTGKSDFSQVSGEQEAVGSWDKIAYVEIGNVYGVIAIDKAESPSYSFFTEYNRKWEIYQEQSTAFNRDVKEFNREVEGKAYNEGTEAYRSLIMKEEELTAREQKLKELSIEIGKQRFKPLGLVKRVSIRW